MHPTLGVDLDVPICQRAENVPHNALLTTVMSPHIWKTTFTL